MKLIHGIVLVAGTCIGSGMIALPITLAKIGLIPSICIMMMTWYIIYYTALINLELNLQLGKGVILGKICKHFAGKKLQYVSTILLKVLSYALLCAYISSGTSIIQMIVKDLNYYWYSFGLFIILLLPIQITKKINSILFVFLLSIIGILVIFLIVIIDWKNIPLIETQTFTIHSWSIILPIVFTSFGFQVIFHTLTNYYQCNKNILKKVVFYGSLIPAVVYIIWTSSVLGVIFNHSPDFYQLMVTTDVTISDLIQELSTISSIHYVQFLVRLLALFAIITSAIGVGLGLVSSFSHSHTKVVSSALTIIPALCIVILFPDAFISILSFAGMILSLLAIIIPIYILKFVKTEYIYYESNNKLMIIISIIFCIIICLCTIIELF